MGDDELSAQTAAGGVTPTLGVRSFCPLSQRDKVREGEIKGAGRDKGGGVEGGEGDKSRE